MIEVEAISGVVTDDHCLLYLTLREKHATAEVVCSNPTIVSIRATEKTLRWSKDDTREEIDLDGRSTTVELPVGWTMEASVSGYTCVVVGVRTPDPEKLVSIPFTAESDKAV